MPYYTSASLLKNDYITIYGPTEPRYGLSRHINLIQYLPETLKETETYTFVKFFEDFLNNMFVGQDGFQISNEQLNYISTSSVSSSYDETTTEYNYNYHLSSFYSESKEAEAQTFTWPDNISANPQYISILEKIYRLTDLQDPDLIDIDYIQFFAKNLGYDVSINRNEIGLDYDDNISCCSGADSDKYLRFVVSNLPYWYKLKSTNNAIQTMLYSFGLIGDLVAYYTDTYLPTISGGVWMPDLEGDLSNIKDNFYPTPHFAIYINVDESDDISFDISKRDQIIRAVDSIKPINTVFRNLTAYFKRYINIPVHVMTRFTRYIMIPVGDVKSDYWVE